MCGLTGFWPTTHFPVDAAQAIANNMADGIVNRGPDDAGVWVDGNTGMALAHRRLSILDLSLAGHQPMVSSSGRYVIAFNGEIYNHLELRKELERAVRPPNTSSPPLTLALSPEGRGDIGVGRGETLWRGHSDTETLLAGFEAWGIEATLKKTIGMFAIALWDRAERRLYLARDRFGEKPLYYGWSREAFVFGSELKALRRYPGFDNPIDHNVVGLYLQFCYVPAPYAIYHNIYKLEPGCVLSLSLSDVATPPAQALFVPARHNSLTIERYWSLAEVVQRGLANPIHDEHEVVEQLEATLFDAVRLQSIADVPLGAFLSGGIDSSTIVALMQAQATRPVRTFTIGFDDAHFNEAEYAKAVAKHLGTDHTELYVSPQQALDMVPLLPKLYCEPFADSSQIPTYLVSKIARQNVTVALSGDAGDELFGGYNRYFWGKRIWRRLSWLPSSVRHMLGSFIRIVPASTWDVIGSGLPGVMRISRLGNKAHKLGYRMNTVNSLDDLYRSLVSEWAPESGVVPDARQLRTLLDDLSAVSGVLEPEHRMMIWDTLTYLPDDILHKVDRAAMGVSLETRVPFLDHRVAELAWRMPLHMKIRNGQGKWALRQVLYRYVPRELIERPKAGFAIPLNQWLRGPLREWAEELLEESRLNSGGVFAAGPIREKWHQHLAGTHDWTTKLWAVLMFQAWIAELDN